MKGPGARSEEPRECETADPSERGKKRSQSWELPGESKRCWQQEASGLGSQGATGAFSSSSSSSLVWVETRLQAVNSLPTLGFILSFQSVGSQTNTFGSPSHTELPVKGTHSRLSGPACDPAGSVKQGCLPYGMWLFKGTETFFLLLRPLLSLLSFSVHIAYCPNCQ